MASSSRSALRSTDRGVARGLRGGGGPHQAALARGGKLAKIGEKKIPVKFQIVSFICLRVQYKRPNHGKCVKEIQ